MCCRRYQHGMCWISQYLRAEAPSRHRSHVLHVESIGQLRKKAAPGHLLGGREATDGILTGAK